MRKIGVQKKTFSFVNRVFWFCFSKKKVRLESKEVIPKKLLGDF